MTTQTLIQPLEGRRFERVLGRVVGSQPGPLLVVTGGIHGNEPAGAIAARRVLDRLRATAVSLRGTFVALAGNLAALAADRRYLSRDLNRRWSRQNVAALLSRVAAADSAEDREQRELFQALRAELDGHGGRAVFLDLHTSSAPGAPFCCMGDTLRNRRLAFALGVPVILGLEETIDGALLEFMNDLGHVAVGVEGGQHRAASTVDHLEAVIWIGLVVAGCLQRHEVPDLEQHQAILRQACRGLPAVVEVRYRHVVGGSDRFRMRPGFASFAPIQQGQVLADDARGEVKSPQRGRILLPLYQGVGEDGFFVSRDVRPFWLRLSAWLRKLRADRLLCLLPGIRRHPQQPDTLVADRRVARWLAVDVFHLFGFRKLSSEADRILFSRRRPDHRAVDSVGAAVGLDSVGGCLE